MVCQKQVLLDFEIETHIQLRGYVGNEYLKKYSYSLITLKI